MQMCTGRPGSRYDTWLTSFGSDGPENICPSRAKWQNPQRNVLVDNIVVIMDHHLPLEKWKLGRVIETCPKDDGMVLVVRLKTQSGELTRPISKLCLLETAA